MRLLPILCCLVASACCFSILGGHKGPNGAPQRGKELWKTVSDMSPEDVDEVAKIIAENIKKVGDRIKKEHAAIFEQNSLAITMAKEYVRELKESMRPIPGGLPPSIPEINMRSGLEEVLIEGDIVMTPDEARNYFRVNSGGRRPKRQAYQNKYEFPRSLWKEGVYYSFDRNLNSDARREVDSAVKFWQENTCIKFYKTNDPNNAPVKPVLNFFPGIGCNSRMGRNPNAAIQNVNLQPGNCEQFQVASHEIAHALGFMHEQSRWDRDEYIWIDTDKVKEDMKHNYDKEDEEENDNYGKQYDFGGNMHYAENFFAKNQGDTVMVANNPDYQMSIGGATGPMFGDVYEMNMLYSCYDRCKTSGTVCHNEGMPNPNNCRVCQCPSGFGGNDCSQRQASSHGLSCGATLAAGANWQTVQSSGVVGAGNYNSREGNVSDPYHCTWHITAPAGKVIEYEVTSVDMNGQEKDALCTKNCYFGGLKVKGQEKTWIPEGMKFCCAKQLGKIRITASNLLIIQPYNHLLYTDFSVQYRIKDAGQPPVSTKSTPKTTRTTRSTTRTTTTTPGGNTVQLVRFKNYILGITPLDFLQSKSICEQFNGHLISLHESGVAEQIEYVFNQVSTGVSDYWIGLHKDAGTSSQYTWVDGSPMDYKNWSPGYPGSSDAEKCGAYSNGKWIALSCTKLLPFVCETPPSL